MTLPSWIERKRKLFIDSNLLVGIVIGQARESLLSRKPIENFHRSDFERLTEFASLFESILTTPFVLSEVNSLINKTGCAREECRAAFAAQIKLLEEVQHQSFQLTGDPSFIEYGLTDVSIKASALEDAVVLTEDEGLLGILNQSGISALRYKDI